MRLLRVVGVPYSDEQIDNATVDLAAQAASDDAGGADLQKRYPNAVLGDVAGKSFRHEEDALIAYLQHLGISWTSSYTRQGQHQVNLMGRQARRPSDGEP